MKTAITGGIGSGKSYVCARLAERGIAVYDCDSAAKRLMRTSERLRQELTALIGPGTYDGQRLDKAKVAAFLLASEANAKAIDAIVHPAVAADFEQSGAEWMECAILFESGFDRLVDKTIAVVAQREVRISRVMERDGISEATAAEWMARQMAQEEVERRADFTIVNDGRLDVDRQIESIINKLK